ncbi:hypothetical protein GFL21_07385 [Rhizobium anhuiense]|uniref:hypothetical protein n=1 Tax=Rhizobium anhuiense TaxID=1184720 RepID=UPI0014420F27|nr:hypothetical protein [Rhizobium anhuiense]NKM54342.1 hypothetical protein [Rhizobium anhuiense]
MAKTATRGRRKAPARGKSRARSSGGGLLPWAVIGIAAIGGIVAHDNWKSIQPMLARQATPVTRETAELKPPVRKDVPAKQVALATPTPKAAPPVQQSQPLPPAAIPTPAIQPIKAVPSPASPAVSETGTVAFGYCGQGAHINCVGDGGVFWYKGEKIVIADMASPVVDQARCDGERRVAFAAKSRLLALLNAGPFTMNAAGKAEPSGAPRVVSRDGRSFGAQLINEGLARKPGAAGAAWCA